MEMVEIMALYTLTQPSDQIFTTPLKLSLINNFANPSWSGRLPLHGSYIPFTRYGFTGFCANGEVQVPRPLIGGKYTRVHTLLKTAALSCKFTKLNTCSDIWLITVVLSAEPTMLVYRFSTAWQRPNLTGNLIARKCYRSDSISERRSNFLYHRLNGHSRSSWTLPNSFTASTAVYSV